MIIHVGGIPGSGKTYICSQLKGVTCVDIDDIVEEAYEKARDNKYFKKQIHDDTFPYIWDKETTLLREKYIQKSKDKNQPFVLVGVSSTVGPDVGFFIKIDDLDATYRRYMIRELNKIVDNKTKIKDIIDKTEDPYFINYDIIMKINGAGLIAYSSYKESYENGLEQAKKDEYQILTQREIIEEIKKLIDTNKN